MSDIPDRERGYSVEPDTATVHERYQDHAPRALRTSALGVTNILDGREAVVCPVCFPEPKAKRGKAQEWPEDPVLSLDAKPIDDEAKAEPEPE